jgi:hypothetical protein
MRLPQGYWMDTHLETAIQPHGKLGIYQHYTDKKTDLTVGKLGSKLLVPHSKLGFHSSQGLITKCDNQWISWAAFPENDRKSMVFSTETHQIYPNMKVS